MKSFYKKKVVALNSNEKVTTTTTSPPPQLERLSLHAESLASDDASVIDEVDMRYTFTDEERYDVECVKRMCDEGDVKYRSIFEIAKFCFVSSSIKNEQKRHNDAFTRLKKKRAFEDKYNFDNEEFEILECVKFVSEVMPDWALACGKLDGKQILGYSSGGSDPSILQKKHGFEKLCKAELTRYDLGAVDLEEARRGFYLVGTAKDLRVNPFAAVKMAASLKVLYDKMNANRIKGIYFEMPRSISIISNAVLGILPSKVRQRVSVGKNLTELKFIKEQETDDISKNLPEKLGGGFCMSQHEWFEHRLKLRDESDLMVKL